MAISEHQSPYSDFILGRTTPGEMRRAAVYVVAQVGKDEAPRLLAALLGPDWRELAGGVS